MKTRIFALGLAVLLVFTMLAGCSGGNSGAGSNSVDYNCKCSYYM